MSDFYYSSVRNTLYEPYLLVNVMTAPIGFYLKEHIHDFYHVNHVLRGSLTVTFKDQAYRISAGCTFVLPPDVPHTISSDEGYSQIGIDVSKKHDSRGTVKALSDIIPEGTLLYKRHPIGVTLERMAELIASPTKRNLLRIAHYADGILLDLIDAVLSDDGSFESRYTRMLADNRPWELNLSDMCHILGMSRTQLERQCSRSFGCGASEYCARLRCAAVCDHLWTDDTLEVIAEKFGFSDAAHLSKFFKSRMGITVGEYRRQLK